MVNTDTVSLTVTAVLKETDKAILVVLEDGDGTEVWVPKSQIDDDSECYSQKSGPGELIVSRWWATKEGLA